jgi:hypothetical protein
LCFICVCFLFLYIRVREARAPQWTGAINQVKVVQQQLLVELFRSQLSCWIEKILVYIK